MAVYPGASRPRPPREQAATALAAVNDAFGADLGDHRAFIETDLDPRVSVLADGLRVALEMLGASVGECQVEVPYAALQLVRHPDGSREWCCAHTPSHCDPA